MNIAHRLAQVSGRSQALMNAANFQKQEFKQIGGVCLLTNNVGAQSTETTDHLLIKVTKPKADTQKLEEASRCICTKQESSRQLMS